MAKIMADLRKLGLDAYKNPNIKFNDTSLDEAVRKAVLESVGGEWNYYSFMKNKYEFYAVVSELLTLPLGETLEGVFDGIIKVDTIAEGDIKKIDVEDQELFRVATIASGNNDIRRQRVVNKKVIVETEMKGIKIYEDFSRFIAGRINWANVVDRARKSYSAELAKMIYNALMTGYNSSVSDGKYSKTGTFAEDKLDELIARVEGKTGMKCAIYGTTTALGKVSTGTSSVQVVGASDKQKEDYAQLGYFQNYKGRPMLPITNPVKKDGSFEFEEDYIYILPQGMDIINVVIEGNPIVSDNQDATKRNDQQIEFLFEQKLGVAVLVASYYGIYKLA